MRWLCMLIIFFPISSFAQVVTGGQIAPNIPPVIAQKNVTLVYNTITGQQDMIIIDANNLNDPAWNPPGCVQYSIPVAMYNQFNGPEDLQDYTATLVSAMATP